MSACHSEQTVSDGIHIIKAFDVADAAALTTLGGTLVATDVGKVVHQLDTDQFWLIKDTGPAVFAELAPTGLPPTGSAGGDLGGTYPNPTVTDLTITNETARDSLIFDGTNWVRAPNLLSRQTGSVDTFVVFPTVATYHTFTTPSVPAGTYEIDVGYVWSHDATFNDFIGKVQHDVGAGLVDTHSINPVHQQEPKDSAGAGAGGTNQRHIARLPLVEVVRATAGTIQVDLQYATTSAAAESTIHESTIRVRRVA